MGLRRSHTATLAKPVLVYDGACGFCCYWVARWRRRTRGAVAFVPFQSLDVQSTDNAALRDVPRSDFVRAVHFFEPDGTVSDGARAVARLVAWSAGSEGRHWLGHLLTALYDYLPGASWCGERAYRTVADHRAAAMQVTRWLWGSEPGASHYAQTAWVFRRWLGLVYVLAFGSLFGQVVGLIGEQGILPVRSYLQAVEAVADGQAFGLERFHLLPTLVWLNPSDAFLRGLCILGVILGLLLIAGAAPGVTLWALWGTYLSLVVAGGDFMTFQWDGLLLEAGLLAACWAPGVVWDRWRAAREPSWLGVWGVRWLLFRLMFGAGIIKIASGDPSWRNLTALAAHYGTQPLPTPLAWYASQLPLAVHRVCTAATLAIQLGAPWLIVAPRRARAFAGLLLAGLEILIALTGNYGFFNFVSIALCLLLFDDAMLDSAVRHLLRFSTSLAAVLQVPPPHARTAAHRPRLWRAVPASVAVALWVLLSVRAFAGSFLVSAPPWPVVSAVEGWLAPFHSINTYGLFARMSVVRLEITVEGSDDGTLWRPYGFRYKPGNPDLPPKWVAPHLPRLDWMMWFAAQGAFEEERWFQSLCDRLFEGSPDVRALLAVDPFPASPPQFIRATRTIYRFTRPGQGSAWWVRVPVGPYSPVLTRGERERLAWRSRRQPRRLAPAAISPRLHVRSVPGSDDNGVVVREVTKAWS